MMRGYEDEELGVDPRRAAMQRILRRARISFRVHMETDKRRTIEEGRPVSRPIDLICIEVPGEPKKEVPYDPESHRIFREKYQAWKSGQETSSLTGTPLKDWGVLSYVDLESLRELGFHTVEQLADPSPEGAKKLGALFSWSKEAKRYLGAKDTATPAKVAALESKIEHMARVIKDLERQNILLCQRIEANEGIRMVSAEQRDRLAELNSEQFSEHESATPEPRKRGRSKKSKTSTEPTLNELT